MKKLFVSTVCCALAFGYAAMPVQAASEINATEAELLSLIENGVSMGDGTLNYSKGTAEYETLKDYVSLPGVDLTEEGLATIKASVIDAQTFFEIYGEEEATPELMAELVNLIVPAADVLGLELSYNPLTDNVTIKDKEGNIILSEDNMFELATIVSDEKKATVALENTGEDFTSTYAILGSLVAILAGAGYMTLKKKDALN